MGNAASHIPIVDMAIEDAKAKMRQQQLQRQAQLQAQQAQRRAEAAKVQSARQRKAPPQMSSGDPPHVLHASEMTMPTTHAQPIVVGAGGASSTAAAVAATTAATATGTFTARLEASLMTPEVQIASVAGIATGIVGGGDNRLLLAAVGAIAPVIAHAAIAT